MDEARRCGATSRQSGERCKRAAIRGGTVCSMHGGKTPVIAAAAERRLAEQEAAKLLGRVWNPDAAPVTDPVEALQVLAGRMRHSLDVLGAQLAEEGPGGPASVAWLKIMGELRHALDGMARLGIAERQVQLEEAQAAIITTAFRAALEALAQRVELLPADRDLVTRAFLAALGAGGADDRPVLVAAEVVDDDG